MSESEELKETIKALRKDFSEDSIRMGMMEETIEQAKEAFFEGKSASDIYNILTRWNK